MTADEEMEGLDFGEHGMHAYDLHVGPGGLEAGHPPGGGRLRGPTTTLATESR